MRFSTSHLLVAVLLFAAALAIGYPLLKFIFYDNVNFTYDRDQTIEYIEATTSGQLKSGLLKAVDQLTVWDDDRMLIVDASLADNVIHVELISTTFNQPESLIINLGSGATLRLDSYEIESTGTYYFYGDIPVKTKIPGAAEIMSIRFRDGESESNRYAFPKKKTPDQIITVE